MKNQEIEKQLKQSGQAIAQVAAKRLAKKDFNAAIMQRIDQTEKPRRRMWSFGLAAAVGLFSLSWLMLQQNGVVVPTETIAQEAGTLDMNFHQLPLQVESSVNKALIQEQEAIIEDLKYLKEQLLSI